jgi:osmotically-inducible protein OsmY
MTRRLSILVAFLMVFFAACGSINRLTPKSMDDTAMKTDVKGKILETDPGKVFDIGVDVHSGVVTLNGTVNTADERRKIVDAANSVHGVKRVIDNIQLK